MGSWSHTRQLEDQASVGKKEGPSPQIALTEPVPFRGCTEHCPLLNIGISFQGILKSNRRGLRLKYLNVYLGLLKELGEQS